jgi:integrase
VSTMAPALYGIWTFFRAVSRPGSSAANLFCSVEVHRGTRTGYTPYSLESCAYCRREPLGAELAIVSIKPRAGAHHARSLCACVITWLFAALRMNEILRLRVGCIRWQREGVTFPETGDSLAADAVCFIDIPVNKTSTEYTKPVDRVVGEAIAAWERVRPAQVKTPRSEDRRVGSPRVFLRQDSSWEELSE